MNPDSSSEVLQAKGAELGGRGVLAARSLAATALASGGICSLGAVAADGDAARRALSALLCVFGVAVYAYELRSRRIWLAARSALGGSSFLEFADELRDAEPLIDFEASGEILCPYLLAEWKDETQWTDAGLGSRSRIVLATFPLEFVPADGLEHSALEFARARAAGPKAASSEVDLRLRLRLPAGGESGPPQPRLLWLGGHGVEWPCPALLLVFCFLLLGLLADIVLINMATAVEWPVRKRFFTVEGGRLGSLSFSCDERGAVKIDGEPERLQSANGFWVRGPEEWGLIEEEVSRLAPDLMRLRKAGRAGQWLALAVAACGIVLTAMSATVWTSLQTRTVLAAAALVVSTLGGLTCLAEWASGRLLLASSARLAGALPGGAMVATNWEGGSSSPQLGVPLTITVSQMRRAIEKKHVPVLRAEFESGSSLPLCGGSEVDC